ncbi:MAG: T9SS type A sorting domain-containing protein [bacterium]
MKLIIMILLFLIAHDIISSDWVQVKSQEYFAVQSINCSDSNNCFALGNYGSELKDFGWRLYKSTNQGITWVLKYSAKNIYEQEDPQIFNVNECVSLHPDYYFIASDDGDIIIKSTDEGSTFRKILVNGDSDYLEDLAMWDTLYGFATNSKNYFTTKDGWETFEKHPKLNTDQTYYSPVFLDSNTVVMTYHARLGWNDGKGVAFVKYHIDMHKWDTLFYFERDPSAYFDLIKSIYFLDDTLGFSCGYRSDTALPDGRYYDIIYKTKDGGNNWELIHKEYIYPYKGFYNNISFYDDKNGMAVGYFGKIAMTNDGGNTWIYEELPNEIDNAAKMLVCWAGRTPLIGTWGVGIFRYEGDFFKFPLDTTDVEENEISTSEISVIVSPNPVGQYLLAGFSLKGNKPQYCNLTLVNTLGQEIATILNENINPGNHSIKHNVSGLTDGTYYLVLKNAEGVHSTPVVILK